MSTAAFLVVPLYRDGADGRTVAFDFSAHVPPPLPPEFEIARGRIVLWFTALERGSVDVEVILDGWRCWCEGPLRALLKVLARVPPQHPQSLEVQVRTLQEELHSYIGARQLNLPDLDDAWPRLCWAYSGVTLCLQRLGEKLYASEFWTSSPATTAARCPLMTAAGSNPTVAAPADLLAPPSVQTSVDAANGAPSNVTNGVLIHADPVASTTSTTSPRTIDLAAVDAPPSTTAALEKRGPLSLRGRLLTLHWRGRTAQYEFSRRKTDPVFMEVLERLAERPRWSRDDLIASMWDCKGREREYDSGLRGRIHLLKECFETISQETDDPIWSELARATKLSKDECVIRE